MRYRSHFYPYIAGLLKYHEIRRFLEPRDCGSVTVIKIRPGKQRAMREEGGSVIKKRSSGIPTDTFPGVAVSHTTPGPASVSGKHLAAKSPAKSTAKNLPAKVSAKTTSATRSSTGSLSAKNLPARQERAMAEDMGLLVSHSGKRQSGRSSQRSKVIIHLCLLLLGLVGTALCLWAMLYTSESEEVVMNMGLNRVANSLDNILALLAYPVIMFTVILTVYAAQQLFFAYRAATNPEHFRRERQQR